jgi:hypothetical protein
MYILIFFKPVVSGDGFSYHAIMEGLVRDHTLNLTNQRGYDNFSGMNDIELYNKTGIYNVHYFPGLSLVSSPIYMVSLFLDDFPVFHIKDDFFLRERGDILIHMASIPVTSLIFLYAGLFLTLFLLKRYYSKKYAWMVVLLVFFLTPLVRYGAYDLSYTHAVEVGFMSILVLMILRDSRKELIGLIIGFLSILKYSHVVFIVPFIGYYLYRKEYRDVLRLLAGFAPFIVFILVYNTLVFGGPLSVGPIYEYQLSVSSFFAGFLWEMIFGRGGILWWSPGILISLMGLIFIKDRKTRFLLISIFLIYAYVIGCFEGWHSGCGYGNRYFILFFPIYCIGLIHLFKRFSASRYRNLFCALLVLLVAYNLLLSLSFLAFPPDCQRVVPVSVLDYWAHMTNFQDLANLPDLIFKKIGIIRFLFEIGRPALVT